MKAIVVPIVALTVFLAFAAGNASPSGVGWPAISPYSADFDFVDGRSAAASVIIRDTSGREVYRLECHTFLYEADTSFDYSGDFECRLTSLYSEERVSTLLTSDPDQPSDWWSRGRFLASELKGQCADYPEYGRVRTFRLRGMELRLELADIRFAQPPEPGPRPEPGFASFRFRVLVKPDPSATSSLTECPKVPPCAKDSPPCFSRSKR